MQLEEVLSQKLYTWKTWNRQTKKKKGVKHLFKFKYSA